MPSAAQTLGDGGKEFLADLTERTATLTTYGGFVTNTGDKNAVINVEGGTCVRTQPVGAGGRFLFPGTSAALSTTCGNFKFQIAVDGETTSLLFSKG